MEGIRVIVDFAAADRNAAPLTLTAPVRVIATGEWAGVRPALQEAVRAAGAGAIVVGFVAYEAAPAFDPALQVVRPSGPAPLAWFGVFDPGGTGAAPAPGYAPLPGTQWTPDSTRAEYDTAIDTIRAAIAAGDVYQVNHTLRFAARPDTTPFQLYAALAGARHGRYHALIETPAWAIVSASPELFIDLRDGVVTTRPMKGTARRGRWLEEDAAAARALGESAKDRAENLMIVDLLRNDLGRVARFGTVHVASMYDVERYPTVLQLTSTITAQLRADCSIDDVFAAMFPCGSVTGAPKIAAMQHIARLERSPRGPYCGAIGVLRPDGSATFSVAIRTILVDRLTGDAVYGAGGGITWDSASAAEYDEVIAKAALLAAAPAFELIETLRLDDGAFRRLDLHIERLRASAAYWDFATTAAEAGQHALERVAATLPVGHWRVRLTVDRFGNARTTHSRLDNITPGAHASALQAAPLDVILARGHVASSNPLLCHKTTAREIYDAHRAAAPAAFDVLLHNEHGHITEFTNGNIVCDVGDTLITPPRTDGLLAGVFREQLLRRGVIRERSITPAEARRCTRMWLINSVREWVPVSLVE
jgi:para-aminobenzoate synthetase / 4-amino-4-deoxychorismate lyase